MNLHSLPPHPCTLLHHALYVPYSSSHWSSVHVSCITCILYCLPIELFTISHVLSELFMFYSAWLEYPQPNLSCLMHSYSLVWRFPENFWIFYLSPILYSQHSHHFNSSLWDTTEHYIHIHISTPFHFKINYIISTEYTVIACDG